MQSKKRQCKEFGFTAGMLKGALAEGRKVKIIRKQVIFQLPKFNLKGAF